MNHTRHDMHHHHSDAVQEESNISRHNHLNTNDCHSMMVMYFHTGFIETILFKTWKTTSIPLFIESWIFIFILSILYEGIREFRQYLEKERLIQTSIISNEIEPECADIESPVSTVHVNKKIPLRYTERVLHSLLYIIYLSLGYILMLIVMTFNVYLFLAIIFGIGTGHFLYTSSCIRLSTAHLKANIDS